MATKRDEADPQQLHRDGWAAAAPGYDGMGITKSGTKGSLDLNNMTDMATSDGDLPKVSVGQLVSIQ